MTTLAINPLRDTTCNGVAGSENSNYGTALVAQLGTVYFGGTKTILCRTLHDFDLSPLAPVRPYITAAQLDILYEAVVGTTAAAWLQRIKRETAPWTELGATWNKYDGANTWPTSCGEPDATTPPRIAFNLPAGNLTITGLKDWALDALDHRSGLLAIAMQLQDESDNPGGGNHEWVGFTRENAPAVRPTFTVAYSPPPEPARRPAHEPRDAHTLRPTAPTSATRPTRPQHAPLGAVP